MNSKSAKALRNQLRQVVQEVLPEVLAGDLYKKLQEYNTGRLDLITEEVRKTLQHLDDRSKSVQDYIVRQVELSKVPVTDTPAESK